MFSLVNLLMFGSLFQVNLRTGLPEQGIQETCTAGAGSLLLEFGILSKLVDDPVFEGVARRAVEKLLHFRSNVTGLLGMWD